MGERKEKSSLKRLEKMGADVNLDSATLILAMGGRVYGHERRPGPRVLSSSHVPIFLL